MQIAMIDDCGVAGKVFREAYPSSDQESSRSLIIFDFLDSSA